MSGVPEHITRVTDLMSTFDRRWFLCGGWAADGWLGRQTRKHGDIDVTVFMDDQRAIFEHLDGWTMVAHDPNVADDTSEPWNGRPLDMPAHVHAPADPLIENGFVRSKDGFNLEIVLNEQEDGDWVLNREPLISRPLAHSVGLSVWGLPIAVPEIIAFFKAQEMRRRDERDFRNLLPLITYEARQWLHGAIWQMKPDHPWLPRLEDGE